MLLKNGQLAPGAITSILALPNAIELMNIFGTLFFKQDLVSGLANYEIRVQQQVRNDAMDLDTVSTIHF